MRARVPYSLLVTIHLPRQSSVRSWSSTLPPAVASRGARRSSAGPLVTGRRRLALTLAAIRRYPLHPCKHFIIHTAVHILVFYREVLLMSLLLRNHG
jgi:hypothetical protein